MILFGQDLLRNIIYLKNVELIELLVLGFGEGVGTHLMLDEGQIIPLSAFLLAEDQKVTLWDGGRGVRLEARKTIL